jgi:hypothetical protein
MIKSGQKTAGGFRAQSAIMGKKWDALGTPGKAGLLLISFTKSLLTPSGPTGKQNIASFEDIAYQYHE